MRFLNDDSSTQRINDQKQLCILFATSRLKHLSKQNETIKKYVMLVYEITHGHDSTGVKTC